MLSIRSKIPPWLPNELEKSLIFKNLLIKEKKISPMNRKIDINSDKIKLIFNKNNTKVDKNIEITVPDHVLLGLILGIINGPLIFEPKIYATVSLKKEIPIIK